MDQRADMPYERLGNYHVERLLGEGGFAKVYLGRHVHMHNQVAIKMLDVKLDSESIRGFLNEARTIASLEHPHIVRILDCDVEHKTPYLIMNYAPNGSLRQRHHRGERVPLGTVLKYVDQITQALQHAHDQRIIHRDVKPENMLLGKNDEILLSDFGIALVGQSSQMSRTQDVSGTVTYMSPEQIQGKPGRATDQYALAITVYEWLAGEPPFRGGMAEMYAQHMTVSPPSLAERVPGLPPHVYAAIHRALAKQPEQRFSSIAAFARALTDPNASTDVFSSPTQHAGPHPSSGVAPTVVASTNDVQRYASASSPEQGARLTPPNGPQPYSQSGPPRGGYSTTPRPTMPTGPAPYSSGPYSPYPPPPQMVYHTFAPPPRKRRSPTCLIVVIVIVLVLGCGFAAMSSSLLKGFSSLTQRDDFSASKGQKIYQANWSKDTNGWKVGGQWKYSNGTIASDGTAQGTYINPINANYFLVAPYLPPSGDYIIEAKIQYNNGASNYSGGYGSVYPQFGFFFRADKEHNGYIASAQSTNYEIYRFEGQKKESLDQESYSGWDTDPHIYDIEVKGNTITLARDNQILVKVADNRFSRAGLIGLIDVGLDINISSFAVYRVIPVKQNATSTSSS